MSAATLRLRPFSGGRDLEAMLALARATTIANLHLVNLPYRLSSWALDDLDNVGLWVSAGGQLRAWAVTQAPFWTIDYTYDPERGVALHREILSWADDRARRLLGTPFGHPCWFVTVFADQTERIRDLEAAGFACQSEVGEDSWSKVLLQHAMEAPLADQLLPTGLTIRPLADESEVGAYVQLHRAVFESKSMTAEWRSRVLRQPEYRADLDLVAAAPDGRLAAFCVGWLGNDADGRCLGQIEPLGVHEDFRNLGLGRAILCEGLRRLYSRGADKVYVETDKYRNAALGLYEGVGFRSIRDVLVYRKDYGE